MNDTIRSILEILETDRPPELKIAAAQVLGELAPKEVGVVKVLEAKLANGEDYLVRHVLSTLAAIRSAAALRVLVGKLDSRHADLAAHLLAEIGSDAAATLDEAFDDASLETRTRILGILGRSADAPEPLRRHRRRVAPHRSSRVLRAVPPGGRARPARRRLPVRTVPRRDGDARLN